MNMKNILLAVSVIVLLMGIMALIPGIDYATEPQWHAAIKIVVGLAGIFVALKSEKNIKNTMLVIGILLLIMGIAGAVPSIDLGGNEPIWHAAIKIVVGLVALFFALGGIKKKKK